MKEHKHLILNGVLNAPPTSDDDVVLLLEEIVEIIDMNILAPARARYCFEAGNEGFTGDVLLTTSHMIYHDWEHPDHDQTSAVFRLDLYSCASFDIAAILHYLEDLWEMSEYDYVVLNRDSHVIREAEGFRFGAKGLPDLAKNNGTEVE